jgi:hypothetical protein
MDVVHSLELGKKLLGYGPQLWVEKCRIVYHSLSRITKHHHKPESFEATIAVHGKDINITIQGYIRF